MPYVRSCGISQKCWCEGQKNSKKIETKIADTKDGRAHAVCRPLYTDLNSNPDNLIRRVAPLSKNGPLPTNLRVVLRFWSLSEYAPYFGHGKARVQQFSEKSEWSWLWGPKPGIPGCVAPDLLQTTGSALSQSGQ